MKLFGTYLASKHVSVLVRSDISLLAKARKLRDSIMEGQDSFIMREFEDAEVEFGEDGGDVIVDVGNNE